MAWVWRDRRVAVTVAIGIAAASGLAIAATMPRGPVTTAQALSAMIAGLAVGGVTGLLLRSRWALLLTPVVHVVVFELARLDLVGPTVDGIELGNTGAIGALIAGRGVHGLVGVLPIVLGAVWGAALARRMTAGPDRRAGTWRRTARYGRRAVALLSTVALVALGVAIARPASTPPIVGPDGQPLPGSIAELTTVRIGGHDQAVLLRGRSVDNPVLLTLAGGPGGSDLPMVRTLFGDLEKDFVVVGWDQRGAGKSYPALDPTDTLTVDRAVADTIELTNHLRERFDEDRIYVLGQSWGSTLGVLAAQRNPELYHAYIGSGQMVDQAETDLRLYHEALAYADRTGDRRMADMLEPLGEPPWEHISGNALALAFELEKLETPYTPPRSYTERFGSSGIGPMGLMGSEYSVMDKVGVLRGMVDMFSVLYPQVQGEIDFRRDATRLDVPVYLIDGTHELRARRDLALQWFDHLQAPRKELFTFETAGHAPAFEHFEDLHRILTETVLPQTYTR
jgi:pimeloyl-ACP methyl ester carboxylesterase